MRIAVDARPLCVPTFGIGRYTRALLDRMTADTSVQWFLYADRPLLVDYSDRPNVTQRTFGAANRLLSLIRTQWTFARWARQDAVDVFWSPRHHLPLRLDRRIRAVVTIHDLVWKYYPETMLPANRLVERLLMPSSLRRADAIIAVSEATGQDLGRFYPKAMTKTRVIPEAAEALAGITPPTSDRYFLFVGTLEPRKNLARLLSAFAAAKRSGLDDCRLVIAGAQGWGPELHANIKSRTLEGQVELLGHVDDRTLHEKMAGAIALCLPSLYEGFGLPALEAMQYGTPVIGANVSSIPEVVADGGILVDPMSPAQMTDAMLSLARDDALRARLSGQARVQAKRFSWDQAATQTLTLLRSGAASG